MQSSAEFSAATRKRNWLLQCSRRRYGAKTSDQSNDLHIHFGDNDAVRFSCVRGCASGVVGQKLMEYHLLLEANSGSRTWYARAPTEANLSDYPSRSQQHDMLPEGFNISVEATTELSKILQLVTFSGDG